ncbi:hypothetical protein CEE45_16775 [Candidatus Heimdallarchaeota archaeon B3_Heim]|nr:MAG: hypothetical protein CEE45_16775 [Candidatus Heimdallarchaeota archaeon B3_Heim]
MEDTQGFIGLWIIDKDSGIPISSFEFGHTKTDSVLFGGFLVALRGMAHDFEIGQLTSFQTNTANLIITGSKEILSVIAISREANTDCWYPTLVTINNHAETFYRSYQEKELIVDTVLNEHLVPEFRRIIMRNIESIKKTSNIHCDPKKEEKVADKLKDSGLW